MTKVFISYSHDSDEHAACVLALSNCLRRKGIDCDIDQYDPAPEEGWPVWMLQKMQDANYVLMICTETYRRRFEQREEIGKGLGVTWEGTLAHNILYRDGSRSSKFIPVVFEVTDLEHIPDMFSHFSHYDLEKARVFNHLYQHLRGELGAEKPPVGKPHFQRTINSDDLPSVEGKLFGRKDELSLLDAALENPDIHIVQFVASGGAGKTKLLRHWLDDNNNRIEALIAWRFYSQGSSEDKQISATPFFMQALKSLDSDKDISDFKTEEEKGEHIADLLREKRCLLVLDGLEPLQQAGRGMRGELKDPAIRKMLSCLVRDHSSLCIITTRLPVHELQGRKQVVQHDLQNLAPEAGVALLRSFKKPHLVHGRDTDMLAAVEEYGRHALALHLLGNALATYLDGDVRKWDTLTELIGDYDDIERHAFKVMQAYEHWLEGTPELKLLYLLGLFDHPVGQEVLEVLWDAEIPGLTAGVPKKAWLVAQRGLISGFRMMSEIPSPQPLSLKGRGAIDDGTAKLPSTSGRGAGGEGANIFDCHPLIREYFGRQLKEGPGEVWRQAHTVLYDYYKELPEKYLPDTLEEMQPLFRAVAHGCSAELYEEVLHNVYWPRLRRSDKQYLTGALGAFLDDLMLIGYFFSMPWETLQNMPERQKPYFLAAAGHDLCSLGRVAEAIKPTKLATDTYSFSEDSVNSTISILNLSKAQLILGEVKLSVASAEKSVFFAKKTNSVIWKVFAYSSYANSLIKSGDFSQASEVLRKARWVCLLRFWDIPQITFGRQGYPYYENLFTKYEFEKIIYLAMRAITLAQKGNRCAEIGNYQLIVGKAYFCQKSIEQAAFFINQAVANLRASATLDELSNGLIVLATLLRAENRVIDAFQGLQEAYEIAEPSGMRLHLTDYHLEMARLILAVEADPTQYPEATPDREQRILPFADQEEPGILTLQSHITEADRLINETGYHRRDAELAELKQRAGMS